MKRQIVLRFTLIVLFALGTYVLGSVFLMQSSLQDYTEQHLRDYLELVDDAFARNADMDGTIADFAGIEADLRITFIDADGTVVADSALVSEDNHLSRPEIAEPGTVAIRQSDTVGMRMMYLAEQLDGGGYLRVAIPLSSMTPFLSNFILLSIVIAAFVIAIAAVFVRVVAGRTTRPLRETVEALKAIPEGRYIERVPFAGSGEINSLTNELNAIARMIADNLRSLAVEKRKLDFILDHMDQGLCILDAFGRVILANRFIADLFDYDAKENLNHDYLYLFRDKAIQDGVRAALERGIGSNGTYRRGDRHYSVAIIKNPDDSNANESILVILADITKERELEILKRDFFTNASHELKSPLTAILGASELIAANMTKSADETVDLAQRIIQEARRMNNLVSDMLDLSKYEQGVLARPATTIDLADVCREVVAALAPLADERKITIQTKLVPASFVADHEHMTQLVRNLVDNAVKYGIEGGHVTVALRKSDAEVELTVADDGIGIPKADQARVFERFYRVDKARSKKTGGTGLGLAIVKHLALAYQGRIALESELGKGTKITVSLPI
jgi:two-component system phosphate regulon sensor histidine kinase PhoR